MERTLAIIKPDAFRAGATGEIISAYLQQGFGIKAMKLVELSHEQAAGFYIVHKDRPFYDELCGFMSSGPVVLLVLEGENVIERNRNLMGPTDSRKAEEGTLRHRFGTDIQNNAVHGSDSPETAEFEINYFFNALEFVK
ncbi:MAG: nucleoside-diphosphate kinase [bacterium]